MGLKINNEEKNRLIKIYNKKIINDKDNLYEIQRLEQKVKHLYKVLMTEEIKLVLQEINIDVLVNEKRRINVNVLKKHGITNMRLLCEKSKKQLCYIDGIGDKSYEAISDIIQTYIQRIEKTITIKLSLGNTTEQLIQTIYELKERKLIEDDISLITKEISKIEKIVNHLKKLNGKTSKIGWLFSTKKTKLDIINHIEQLEDINNLNYLDNNLLSKFLEKTNNIENYKNNFKRNSASYYTYLETICDFKHNEELLNGGISNEIINNVNNYELDQKYMTSTLRAYQEFGTKYILNQKNVLIGDEMGLGKTIQALCAASDLYAKEEKYFIVVCPLSLLENWVSETKKHTTLPITKIYKNPEIEIEIWKNSFGVGVTTYETLKYIKTDDNFKISMLVVDEAHYIKNPEAQRTQILLNLAKDIERKVFMTGTPIENKVDEMCFLIENLNNVVYEKIKDAKYLVGTESFKEDVSPVYLRRKREDVLKELPELIEVEEWVELSNSEIKKHKENMEEKHLMNLRRVSWECSDVNKSTKAKRLLEICDDTKEEGRKIIVFSYFKDTISKVTKLLEGRCMMPLTGDVKSEDRQTLIDEFADAVDKDVLVAQVMVGGVGLNIQCASVVIFCEPQWKPSTEVQALSRAYRMGQINTVLVHRLLARNSIDERILKIKHGKEVIFDEYADDSIIQEKIIDIEALDNLISNTNE
ncbi:MAG: DEAD/DEAH box helicase [bacterium]